MGASIKVKDKDPLLSFSTLGCPDWSFDQIISFAGEQGYNGIELRGIQRELDLTRCKEFSSAAAKKQSLERIEDAGLRFVNLGSSCTLHFNKGEERTRNIDEGKRFIDLANDIECPYIRVFPNIFPKEQTKEQTISNISNGLLELGNYAKGSKVKVLLETHGDLLYTADIETLMKAASGDHVGLTWDICNMWSITKEDTAEVYERLQPHIYHTHIKDAKLVDGKLQYTLLGRGEIPILKTIDLLWKNGYNGFYSFEWEKLWHPEIDAPGTALTDYIKVMKEHFN